jgi:hypothetical protein
MFNTTYTSDYDTWHSVMGWTTFPNDAPVIMTSNMQHTTDLLVTESELSGAAEMAQDMLFMMWILELVKKPMILYINNKGAKDSTNNCRQTCHSEVQQYFLCKLKEQGLIVCVWTSGTGMYSDLFHVNYMRSMQVSLLISTCCLQMHISK